MNEDPQTWEAPKWHPDFGNPERELLLLRAIATQIQGQVKTKTLRLDVAEEGYMSLCLEVGSGFTVEIVVIDCGHRDERFGVFVNAADTESESYFADSGAIVSHIIDSCDLGAKHLIEKGPL